MSKYEQKGRNASDRNDVRSARLWEPPEIVELLRRARWIDRLWKPSS